MTNNRYDMSMNYVQEYSCCGTKIVTHFPYFFVAAVTCATIVIFRFFSRFGCLLHTQNYCTCRRPRKHDQGNHARNTRQTTNGTTSNRCEHVPLSPPFRSLWIHTLGITGSVGSARELVAPTQAASGLRGIEASVKTMAETLSKTR